MRVSNTLFKRCIWKVGVKGARKKKKKKCILSGRSRLGLDRAMKSKEKPEMDDFERKQTLFLKEKYWENIGGKSFYPRP